MLLSNGLLSPRPDIAALSERYRLSGCVTIPGFLSPDMAAGLHGVLADWRKWTLVTRIDGQHRGFDAEALEQVESSGRTALDELVLEEARKGFQYLYERHPLYDPEYPSCPGSTPYRCSGFRNPTWLALSLLSRPGRGCRSPAGFAARAFPGAGADLESSSRVVGSMKEKT